MFKYTYDLNNIFGGVESRRNSQFRVVAFVSRCYNGSCWKYLYLRHLSADGRSRGSKANISCVWGKLNILKKNLTDDASHSPSTGHSSIRTAQDKDRGAIAECDSERFHALWTMWTAIDWTTADRLICGWWTKISNISIKSETLCVSREYLVELILFGCTREEWRTREHFRYDAGGAPDVHRTVVWLAEQHFGRPIPERHNL